jgi:hypothetical protein
VQERVQWRAGYENWRTQNRLPDTPENRERFNTERGYPKGSSSAAPAKPAPGQAGAATGTTRGPNPAGGAGTGMLNAIRARQGLPPLPPGSRIGSPQFSETAVADSAANVGGNFPRGNFDKLLREARPSSNVDDTRSSIPGMATVRSALTPDDPLHWEVTPESAARFNPNDPMTRSLMGSKRGDAMREDVLRNMTREEFMDWLGEMRQQGNQLLNERYRPVGPQ